MTMFLQILATMVLIVGAAWAVAAIQFLWTFWRITRDVHRDWEDERPC